MDELTHARLMTALVVLVFIAFWGGGILRNRRRHARFAALAQSFGREVIREEGLLSRFSVDIGGRTFEVRLQHIRRPYSRGSGQWYFITETVLRGASDLHSSDVRARWGRPQAVDPRDSDSPRDDWLNDRVRTAIAHFYALDLPLDPLSLEAGRLVHKSHLPVKRFEGEILRELLTRQATVAAAIEQTV